MIINFITKCASFIRISKYDSASSGLITNNYSIKTTNDIASYKLTTESVSSINFTIYSTDVKLLKEINLDVSWGVNSTGSIKIETSLDCINWTELEYKEGYSETATVVNDKDKVMFKYIYKSTPASGYYFNTKLKTLDTNVADLKYVYKKTNELNKEVSYIYDNLEWKFIKITLSGLQASSTLPIYIKNLEIFIDEPFDSELIDLNLLELKSSIFTKSKIYQEYDFIPDVIRNYMKMIEEKNITLNNINYVPYNLIFNPLVSTEYPRGIGFDIIGVDLEVYP